ncbi:penicillin-binding protein 1C [Stenomitos frigidus]|uniref:Penicillin-binding protein 1C n=1 Tax=Stenomitos frigidus ULC18 TaxID=2107698 RepID=A0A2T1EA71_9CYAN|nr:transglycosylase domain-containing protein [Stenomitos frigidus]PSB29652.1 penicillin-binding protein 1C [Stenomitos frigidus ULC18]
MRTLRTLAKRRSAIWRRYRRSPWSIGLTLVIICLVVRSLPYLAPIHAAALVQEQQAIAFTDRNGLPLGTVLTRDQEHTVTVPLDQVSTAFKHAIIAAEDGRFYQHGALDGRAIVRAFLEAVQARQLVSGASTITMQLARMLEPSPRKLPGKVKEIWTSWRLTAGMNKDEILQAYINRLPMGGNVYGIEAAARIYFGIPASDLNVAQASLLAGLPNDPTRLNPYDRWQALKRRQTYVLDRMVQDRYLSRAAADRAFQEALSLQPRQQGIIAAPHFLFWLADQRSSHPAAVQTTLDRPLQQFVEAQVQQVIQALAPHNVHHAAALVLDNHSGDVLAYVGSPNYFADAQSGRNDGVQALRQPGSTLKPFLYELALEQQVIRPNTVLADVPTRYAIPGAKLYTPSDYSETFQGPVRVRVALANSLNVPAVRVLEKVSVKAFLDRLHQLGFTHLTQTPDYYGLGLALGGGEVSLWELARAYLALANRGEAIGVRREERGERGEEVDFGVSAQSNDVRSQKSGVRSQESAVETNPKFRIFPSGTLREQNSKLSLPLSPLTSSSTSSLITDMLSDAHARAKAFGVNSLLSLPFPTAVKTGTSSDFRDTWTVGFSTDYTVAVWVGNFDGQPMQQVSGVTGAAPLWNRIMLHLHEHREPIAFPPPMGLVKRPICALSGARPTPGCPSVVQEYFALGDLSEYDRQPDPFYQAVVGSKGNREYRLKLPPEYNEWLAMQPLTPTAGELRILSPRNGDVFLLEAGASPDSAQQLQFRLANSSTQTTKWRLNGQTLTTPTPDSVFWRPKPGNWTLEVKRGDVSDRVTFEVQVAERRSTRKGFSIAQ